MKLPVTIPKDRELVNLLISGSAVLLGLFWVFFGNDLLRLLLPDQTHSIFYYFFSGAIFSLAFIGLYGFIRTILCFTEFMVEQDNLNALLYENLLEDEHEGIFLKNKKGVYKIISPVARQVLELEGHRVIGHTDTDLHKPITANRIIHEDQRVINFSETVEWETTLNTNHGTQTFHCKKYPCIDHRGKTVGIIGVCKNITIIKTFQSLNLQLEGRYQNLFNTLPYPALVLDVVSMQPYTFNDAMCRLLGYEKEVFGRMRMSLHVQPEDLPDFQYNITHLNTTGGGEFETTLITQQRDLVNVTGYTQEVYIEDKRYLHMLLYDSTETKKSTQVLISSELKYRSLFEHANDAIVVVSPRSLNIIDANEIAIITLGYSRDDILLLSIQDLDPGSDHSLIQSKIADLEIYNHALYEHKIKTRQGDIISVEINAHKLNYGNDDVYQFVLRNIVARKQTEAALIASEQRYRQMFESNRAIKLVIDPDNFSIEDANPAAAQFYGYTLAQLKGMSLSRINILSRDKLNTLIQQTREQNLGFYSCPHRLSNGEIRFVEVRDGPMEIDGRQLFYSIIYDVTASKEAENQILVASKMFDYSTDAVMLINDLNQVVSVNYAFTQITGYQQSEVQNASPEIILANSSQTLLNEDVLADINQSGQWKGEIWHRLKNGQSRPLSATINGISSEDNVNTYVVMLTARQNELFSPDNQTHFTELTQLPNRSLFIDRLQNAIERARRNKFRLGVILIDFRQFTEVNASFGYDMGDILLKAIANRLKYNTRNTDTIGHFGSDDFAVLIEDLHDIQQMGIVLQKLLSTLAESYQSDHKSVDLNVSMGVSIYPEDGEDSQSLLDRANFALDNAQLKLGNHFELTNDTMSQLANLWLQTEANLHTALREEQFFIQYMPIVDSKSNDILFMEALIRWQHPQQGCLLPHQFLPAAEQSGFIGAIGLTVIEQALLQMHDWMELNLPIQYISINICPTQLDTELIDILLLKSRHYNIPTSRIALEFSQMAFSDTDNQRLQLLSTLSSHGFYIILDDFGMCSQSLSGLLQYQINAIKLHHTLILQSQQSEQSHRLLDGILSLCHTMDVDVLGEGIETLEECEYLQSLSINTLQGHYFSPALDGKDITGFSSNYTTS